MAAELRASLRQLVVSAERSLARFPLTELAYPCSACGRSPEACACHPVQRRDSGIQTSPMYEMDSSIPHIDSDDEHSDSSFKNKDFRGFVPAERLSEFNETVTNSGIYLPGLHDKDGRALLVVEGEKLPLDPTEAARFLHYLATLPHSLERRRSGLRVLTTLTNTNLDVLDSTLYLVSQQEKVSFSSVIVYTKEDERCGKLIRSKIEFITVPNKERLLDFIAEDQLPSTFGGDATHDQQAWTAFFKGSESLGERCREAGRRLVSALAGLGTGEPIRQVAVMEARSLSRAVGDTDLSRLRSQAPRDVQALTKKSLRLPASEDVRFVLERVEMLYKEVDSTASRLEELAEKRREKLKDIARVRALEKETEQVLSWLSHKGDDCLRKHKELATTLPAIKQQEQDFEQFYFISMKQLDKGTDLLEEAVQCSSPGSSGLRDLARSLKNHIRGFSDRLEDTRERLEDTSRCFYLLDRAYEWALEAMKHMSLAKGEDSQAAEPNLKVLEQYLMAHPQPTLDHYTEMISLATKLDNESLLNQCKLAQCRCEDTAEQIQQLLGPEPRWPTRRRSAPCQGGEVTIGEEEGVEWTGEKTWHYHPAVSDDEEDKLTSSAENTTDGSESGTKGCEEIDENDACCGKAISPIPVNSHLHSDLSVEVDGQCGTQTLKTKKTMLLIMKEMIQTERDYVRSLEYVIENYIPELLREDIPQAMRGQRNVIFGNIEKIFEFHSHFFLQELEKCEQSPLHVGQFFLRHEKKFYLYALYNKNKPKSDSLMSEYGTAFFKAKQLELGDKMDLASYLLKPVQRMGKYALLLQQLMKATRQDVMQLKDAETMVRFQLRHGNDLLAMDSLRDCDVNVKEQGRLLRQNEFLVWQGKGSKKYYRHVFLFEELILFSKARRFPDYKNLDLYLYKQSIKTSDIGLTAKVGDSSTKFEIWFRKRKPNDTFTLQAISEEIKQAWTLELSNLLWKQALRNREVRIAEMSSMGIGNKPCLDIRPSVNQICDRSISIAQLSKTAPRFRNSIAISPVEVVRKRPHSIISVTSSSGTSSTSSASSSGSGCERRESSHCSSAESGIVSDWNSSVTSDSPQHHSSLSVKL